jgi:sterol desaturase/sphingolipid hydroxylase (fatty acid hydroxylase superfamily)
MQAAIGDALAWKTAAVAAWFVLLFALERAWPAARPRLAEPGWRRLARNASLWAGNTLLWPLAVLPVSTLAVALAPHWRPAWWSGVGGLLLDLLLLDFLIYWWHRANHVLPFLWRFHAIHHLDRFLDTTTAVRFHAGEVLLSALARAVVILLLALPFSSVLVFETLVLAATLFHHSNLRLPPRLERALSLVVVTPSIHWVHHHRRRIDTDANYATVLSLWDRLFSSRSPRPRLPDMAIGVEDREEASLPRLLAAPFRRFPSSERSVSS